MQEIPYGGSAHLQFSILINLIEFYQEIIRNLSDYFINSDKFLSNFRQINELYKCILNISRAFQFLKAAYSLEVIELMFPKIPEILDCKRPAPRISI